MTPEVPKEEKAFRPDLTALFEEHHTVVYRAAFRLTQSREDAEDVMQTVFTKLVQAQLPSEFFKNPPGYLYRAAVNETISLKRSRDRARVADDVDLEFLDSLAAPACADETCHDEELHRIRAAMAAIAMVNPDFAETLGLCYVEGYKGREIAKIQRRPVATVRVVLWRALRELKRQMRIKENLRETKQKANQTSSRPMLAD